MDWRNGTGFEIETALDMFARKKGRRDRGGRGRETEGKYSTVGREGAASIAFLPRTWWLACVLALCSAKRRHVSGSDVLEVHCETSLIWNLL